MWVAAAQAAVAVVNNPGTNSQGNSALTDTYSFALTAAISNPALIALVSWNNIGSAITVSSVVWDSGGTNQAMTLITGTNRSQGNCSSALYGLVGSITSGTKNLVVTFNSSTDSYLSAISFSGVNQTGGATSFPNGTTNANAGSTSATVVITTATGDAVVGGGCEVSSATITPSNTQIFKDTTGVSVNAWGNTAAGASGTVTLSATLASTAWTYSGTDVAASGAGAVCPKTRATLGVGC